MSCGCGSYVTRLPCRKDLPRSENYGCHPALLQLHAWSRSCNNFTCLYVKILQAVRDLRFRRRDYWSVNTHLQNYRGIITQKIVTFTGGSFLVIFLVYFQNNGIVWAHMSAVFWGANKKVWSFFMSSVLRRTSFRHCVGLVRHCVGRLSHETC